MTQYVDIPDKLPDQKYLVAGGCSFTTNSNSPSWPESVCSKMNMVGVNTGTSAIGNNIIFLNVLYVLQRMLKQGIEKKDIVVVVMWSHADRLDYYRQDHRENILPDNKLFKKVMPVSKFVESSDGHWVPFSPSNIGWISQNLKDGGADMVPESTKEFVRLGEIMMDEFYRTDVSRVISTMKNILALQEFLKNNGIKYLFAKYIEDAFIKDSWDHPEASYLVDLIDWDMFIPDGEFEWCYDNTDLPFKEQILFGRKRDRNMPSHPTPEQHDIYAEQVIVPRLKTIL